MIIPTKEKGAEISRRDLLKTGGALATVTLAPGVTLMAFGGKANADGLKPNARWGLLIDAAKCPEDCSACVSACSKEQGWESNGLDTDPQWIRKVTLREKATGRENSLPVMCQHCDEPPCVDVCPTGASFKREDGIVLVNRHTCIGCRYCMMACPYKARSFIHAEVAEKLTHTPRGKGCVESCNLCVHRLDNGGRSTACQDACKHQAIVFGDLNDPDSAVSQALKKYPSVQIRADLKLNTGVRYSNI